MRKRAIWAAVGAAVVLAVAGAAWFSRSTMSAMGETHASVPTWRVERGSLALTVHLRGELRAARQQAIMTPPVGAALRILSLVDSGSAVTQGDVILEFDPADQQYNLQQAESELQEAEQEIIKQRADNEARAAQDEVALLTADFDVKRAELDARVDRDLIPANEYQIRQVSLEEARRKLAQTRQDVASRQTTSRAALAVLEEKRLKAKLAADRARQNIESLRVTAPIDGVVSIRENVDASGGVLYSGMVLPSYRIGDTANPGRPVLDIFDVSKMEIRTTVNEQDRPNLAVGEPVTVTSDVVPDVELPAKITAIAGLGRTERYLGPLRLFDVTLVLDRADPRLRPGTSVDIVAPGKSIDDVLVLPRQAVFEQDGKPIVYVRSGAGFEPAEIKVLNRTEARVAIEGIDEGAEVALVDPGRTRSRDGATDATAATAPAAAAGRGR